MHGHADAGGEAILEAGTTGRAEGTERASCRRRENGAEKSESPPFCRG